MMPLGITVGWIAAFPTLVMAATNLTTFISHVLHVHIAPATCACNTCYTCMQHMPHVRTRAQLGEATASTTQPKVDVS